MSSSKSKEKIIENESVYARITRERKEGKKPNSIGYYDFERSIGEGNFAKVKLATHTLTGAKVAIKIVDKTKISKAAAEKLVREVRILKTLNHPHICRLYEVIDTPQEVFLIMEYAEGGELFDYLVAHGRMKEKEARRHFRQIVSAIHYCHQQHVIHRDLKAENLLLDEDLNAKIADFGFSNNFEEGKQLNTWCGSPPYAAPELFQGKEYFGPEIDIWSLGVVLYVLVCGALPFDGSTLSALRSRVLSGKFKVPFYMSTDCEQLIKKMLVVEPSHRITLDGVLKDKWFNEGHEPLRQPDEVKIVITPTQHEEIVARLEDLGISRERVEKNLKEEGFDHVWAAYHLIADQFYTRKPVEPKENDTKVRPVTVTRSAPSSSPSPSPSPAPAPAPASPSASSTPASSPSASSPASPSPPSPSLPPSSPNPPTTSSISSQEQEGSKSSGSQEKVAETKKKPRRHTVNHGQVDVDQIRKEMLSKKTSKAEMTPASGSSASSTTSSASTSPPSATSSASATSTGSTTAAPAVSPAAPLETDSVPTGTEASVPIPRNTKDRRHRALSLSAPQRPASLYLPSVRTEEPSTASPVINGGPSHSNAPAVSSPLNPNAPPAAPGSSSPQRLRQSEKHRRISFKEKFMKTLGFKEIEPQTSIEPRTLRFHFSMSTTSAKDPREILVEVERVLTIFEVAFERDKYLFLCRKENVAFEVEICKLPRLSMNGLRFKRLAGDQWGYKNLCTEMISKMRL